MPLKGSTRKPTHQKKMRRPKKSGKKRPSGVKFKRKGKYYVIKLPPKVQKTIQRALKKGNVRGIVISVH